MAAPRIQRSMMTLLRPWIGTCEETEALLSDHLEVTLPARQERRVRRHLVVCARCRALFASLARVVASVRDLGLSADEPVPSIADALAERLRREGG